MSKHLGTQKSRGEDEDTTSSDYGMSTGFVLLCVCVCVWRESSVLLCVEATIAGCAVASAAHACSKRTLTAAEIFLPPREIHTGEIHTGEIHAGEIHASEIHAGEIQTTTSHFFQ